MGLRHPVYVCWRLHIIHMKIYLQVWYTYKCIICTSYTECTTHAGDETKIDLDLQVNTVFPDAILGVFENIGHQSLWYTFMYQESLLLSNPLKIAPRKTGLIWRWICYKSHLLRERILSIWFAHHMVSIWFVHHQCMMCIISVWCASSVYGVHHQCMVCIISVWCASSAQCTSYSEYTVFRSHMIQWWWCTWYSEYAHDTKVYCTANSQYTVLRSHMIQWVYCTSTVRIECTYIYVLPVHKYTAHHTVQQTVSTLFSDYKVSILFAYTEYIFCTSWWCDLNTYV